MRGQFSYGGRSRRGRFATRAVFDCDVDLRIFYFFFYEIRVINTRQHE